MHHDPVWQQLVGGSIGIIIGLAIVLIAFVAYQILKLTLCAIWRLIVGDR